MVSIHARLPGLNVVRSPMAAFHRADASFDPASVERDTSDGLTHAALAPGTLIVGQGRLISESASSGPQHRMVRPASRLPMRSVADRCRCRW